MSRILGLVSFVSPSISSGASFGHQKGQCLFNDFFRSSRRGFLAIIGLAVVAIGLLPLHLLAGPDGSGNDGAGKVVTADSVAAKAKKRVAVLSAATQPAANTSQGHYIHILNDSGFDARAISAADVRKTKLEGFAIFIIGGGSGSAFNMSLGPEGGNIVRDFVRKGGGALASCAGGYSFANGQNEALKYIAIAKADIIDAQDGRWARGKGVVEIVPADDRYCPLKMFYANGPLWRIATDQGTDRTVALARFNSDVKKENDPGGVMPGTPAILAGTFGEGRFVLFSGHPEFYKKLGNQCLVSDAARWVTRGRLTGDQSIGWEDVFPSSQKVQAGNAQ